MPQPPLPPGSEGAYVHPAEFRKLANVVRSLTAEHQALTAQLSASRAAVADLEEKAKKAMSPRYIEDVPGKRSAYWYSVKVAFDTSYNTNGTQKNGSVTISQDGPFVCTQIMFFWQVTTGSSGADADIINAFMAPTRYPNLIRAITAAPTIERDVIDFLITIKSGGSDRLLNHINQIPAAAFNREDRPEYLGLPHWFERNEVISVDASVQISSTAGNAPDSAARGTLWGVFAGYKILRPIDYATAFGFA